MHEQFFVTRQTRWYRCLRVLYGGTFTAAVCVCVLFIWSAPEWAEVNVQDTRLSCGIDRVYTAAELDLPLRDVFVLIDQLGAKQPPVYAWRAHLVGELSRSKWQWLRDAIRIEGVHAEDAGLTHISRGAKERLAFLCGVSLFEIDTHATSTMTVYPAYQEPYTTMNKIIYTHLFVVLLFVVFECIRRYVYHVLFGTWFPGRDVRGQDVLF